MIKSKNVKIKYTKDNTEIENLLKNMGVEPLRWAVVKVFDNELEISVSFED